MSKIFLLLLFSCSAFAQQPLNVLTFNIRYNNPGDSANTWQNRKEMVCSQINFYETDILGIQEGLHDQVMDLQRCLPEFSFAGVGRDDGKEKGEYAAIFYRNAKFELKTTGHFWLSPTPQVPGSMGWDAACTRECTYVLLQEKKSGKQFYIFDTHLDHIGKLARANGVTLILKFMDSLAAGYPVIFMGDFNTTTDDDAVKLVSNNLALPLFDSKTISQQPHYGPGGTFNAFKTHELTNQPIDYIFVSTHFNVVKHATVSESWMGRFSSDHFPVFASLDWK